MRTVRHLAVAAVVVATLAWTTDASAQYFGRNKVQYKKLDFQVLKTEHFDIYFYPSEREGIEISARLAERWNTRLERLLAHKLRGRQPLVLYASHPDFEQTNAIEGELGEGTGGVTEPLKRRIILPLGGPVGDTDHVIGHELVHAFQFDITAGPNAAPGENGAERLPLWFIEGMAEYLSLGPVDPNTAMWLRDAAREPDDKSKLPSIDELDNPKYFPYRWGQAFWAYVGGKYGDAVIPQLLRIAGATGDPAAAIKRVLGVTTKELSEDWRAAIRAQYQPVLRETTPPGEVGRVAIKATGLGGDLNVGPAISPDGRWIAFLSERSIFSIDLFIADAATGKVVRKLTSTATDPHYSSIQFIYSAGGWDAESKRIAIATVVSGHPALAIFNAQTGAKERELSIPTVDEVFNPTWSPDGNAICFTGMGRGLTDLYVVNVNSSEVRQLTHDAYADLQPAWSPDGKRIAFATDRFSSRLDSLDMGPYHLALLDPQSGDITELKAFSGGKHLNPQWSGDSQTIYFVSDRDGIPNLYRIPAGGGAIRQLTNIATGLSGITATSPTMSVASRAGVAAFSVYDAGKYNIATMPVEDAASREVATTGSQTGAELPPAERRPSEVAALLANASLGLPAPAEQNDVAKYKPSLSLAALGQPTVGVGVSRFGTAVGGGLSAYFTDMLGDHSLVTAVQFNSTIGGNYSFKDTAVQAAYMNQAHRWNWGLVGGQVPYLSGGFAQSIGTVQGTTALIDQTIIYRQTERSAAGIVAYPINRSRRIELQGGVTQMIFDQVLQTQAYSIRTGQLLAFDTSENSIADSLTMTNASAAYVSDTSNFGATSPVQGERMRFEAAPTFGSINFTSMLADYRRYFMPASFYTIAFRGMHYGRYGSGGEDARLFPLYLGYPSLVRGYDVYSFDNRDCIATATSSCPAIDRLLGSRMFIGNLEFRFPLLRPFGASQGMYGPLPVELAFFADAGVAWNSLDNPVSSTNLLGTNTVQPHPFRLKDGVSSAGAALRVNFFGFAVGEFDFVKAFQRPSRGWIFQFNLTPGF